MARKKIMDITPHTSLMRKLSYTTYRLADSLAEFMDNSLDARIPGSPVTINIRIDKNTIIVKDDARGMNEAEARICLKLAETNKEGKKKLGQFGLGLKTGALSLGKKFTVITTRKQLKNQFRIEFDEEKFEKEGDWRKYPFFIEPKELDHGTIITIKDLKVSIYREAIRRVRKKLALRFEPFLKLEGKEKVTMIVNDLTLEAPDLEFKHENNFPIYFMVGGKKINGWFNFLKKRSIKGNYGFNLFKEGRLIEAYTKDEVGLKAHPELAQVYGELHLDRFSTTHNKMKFLMDTDEFEELKEKLVQIIKEPLSKHMKSIREERKKKKIVKTIELLRDFFTNINIDSLKPELQIKEELTSDIEREKLEKININNKWYTYEVKLSRLGNRSQLVDVKMDKSHIVIETNIDFPIFELKDNPDVFTAIILLTVSDALSRIIIKERGEGIEFFDKYRDQMLSNILVNRLQKKHRREVTSILSYI